MRSSRYANKLAEMPIKKLVITMVAIGHKNPF